MRKDLNLRENVRIIGIVTIEIFLTFFILVFLFVNLKKDLDSINEIIPVLQVETYTEYKSSKHKSLKDN